MFKVRNILQSFIFFSLLVLALCPTFALAQSKTNAIGLALAKINQLEAGKTVGAEVYNPDPANINAYSTKVKVTPDDDLRYRWAGFIVDIKNANTTVKAKNGYIKVYLGKESKEENFITNAGVNLPIKDIKDKLIEGENTILLQVVTNDGKPLVPTTEITFTFNYNALSTSPGMEIVSPKPGAVLSSSITQDFNIKTPNFTLENNPIAKSSPTNGKMAIYWDEVKPEKLIATVYKNEFKSSEYDFSKIEDGLDRKIIFVLKDSKDNPYKPSITSSVTVKSNFRGSIDIGLPKITFVQPDKSATNLDLSESDKISVKIDNFELTDNTSDKKPEDGHGVLQVSLDGKKIGDSLTKTEFTLGELNIGALEKGQKELKVELVSKNYEALVPEAKDSIKFNFLANPIASSDKTQSDAAIEESQNPAWKIVIIILIVILIIGGIAVLITKA